MGYFSRLDFLSLDAGKWKIPTIRATSENQKTLTTYGLQKDYGNPIEP